MPHAALAVIAHRAKSGIRADPTSRAGSVSYYHEDRERYDASEKQMNSPSYTVRLLGPSDNEAFEKVAPGVFYKPADATLTAEFLNDPRHHIVVALSEGQIIGSATATHYLHPSRPPTLFIIGVAVSPGFRRQGVGKAMLNSLLQEARRLGCVEAKVGAEVSNGAAQSLYSGIGGALDPDDYVTYTISLGQ
jgi:ribosomal protein S18 acetylase RimI-like enzyme